MITKVPVAVETMVGTGWDQLLAMMTVFAMLAAAVTGSVLLWLRFRLRAYFVTKPDHMAMKAVHEAEHAENTHRLAAMEDRLAHLAGRHLVAAIEQRQEALYAELVKMKVETATVSEQIRGVALSGTRIEHMMDLILKQMMDRDPTP